MNKQTDYNGFRMEEFECDGRACKLVTPSAPAPGKRWIWKAEFFEAFPAFELEMLRRGWYLAYMDVGNTFGCPRSMRSFDRFYERMTAAGFSRFPVLLGLSRGGLYIYNWAKDNADKVGALYGDNPVCDFCSWPGGKYNGPGSLDDWKKLIDDYGFQSESEAEAYHPQPWEIAQELARTGVPLVHAAGTDDEVVPIAENTDVLEKAVLSSGGKIKVFRHPGFHHPHGLSDPTLMADWIEAHARS